MTFDPYRAGQVGNFGGIDILERPYINGMLLIGGNLVVGSVPDEPPIYEQVCKDLGMKPLPPSKERRPALDPHYLNRIVKISGVT